MITCANASASFFTKPLSTFVDSSRFPCTAQMKYKYQLKWNNVINIIHHNMTQQSTTPQNIAQHNICTTCTTQQAHHSTSYGKNQTQQHKNPQHGTARHGTARHGTARHGTAQYRTTQDNKTQRNATRHSTEQTTNGQQRRQQQQHKNIIPSLSRALPCWVQPINPRNLQMCLLWCHLPGSYCTLRGKTQTCSLIRTKCSGFTALQDRGWGRGDI